LGGRFDLNHNIEIYYTQSRDGGFTWSSNIPLSDTDQFHSQLSAICVNNVGSPIVTWMDYKYTIYLTTGDILLRQSNDSGSTWAPETQLTFNHLARGSDVVSSGDTIIVAWEDNRFEDGLGSIYCTRSIDGGINWDEPYWVDGDTNNSINPAIATSYGRIYIVWYDLRPPDSLGLFFSRYDPENDAIGSNDLNNISHQITLSAYPNPFNSSVFLSYSSVKGGDLEIFNSLGQLVRIFRIKAGERNKMIWDATDWGGEKVSSGIYFIKLSTDRQAKTVKLIYLK
jgi:hypothetical protein